MHYNFDEADEEDTILRRMHGELYRKMGFATVNDTVYAVDREYAIPDYIGCMVVVTYRIIDTSLVGFEHIEFDANMHTLSSDINDATKAIIVYNRHTSAFDEDETKDDIEAMLNLTEEKLKNVCGMLRIDN
ncbi:MAG: hypothetical protein K5787_12975 [Lentisphaeria bacterium]|nr:hypothetical protein [Lentisphaeria bacterium]